MHIISPLTLARQTLKKYSEDSDYLKLQETGEIYTMYQTFTFQIFKQKDEEVKTLYQELLQILDAQIQKRKQRIRQKIISQQKNFERKQKLKQKNWFSSIFGLEDQHLKQQQKKSFSGQLNQYFSQFFSATSSKKFVKNSNRGNVSSQEEQALNQKQKFQLQSVNALTLINSKIIEQEWQFKSKLE